MDERRTKRGLRSRANDRAGEDDKVPRAGAGPAGGGGIFKSAAVAVLRQHRKLMTTGDITRLAVEIGLLKCQGKTPEATMASALYTDVKRKLQKSLFTRPQEGLFGLREWLEEGYYPEGWVGPPDGLGLAPFKRRNSASAHAGGSGGSSPSKAGRQGVRTGPGRSSKARASRSWRNAGSDAEDEDILLDDEDSPVGHTGSGSRRAGAISPTEAAGGSGGAALAEDEDGDEVMAEEGDEGDAEEVEGEEAGGEGDGEAQEDPGGQERRAAGGSEANAGHAAADGQQQAAGGGRELASSMGGARLQQQQQPATSSGGAGGRRGGVRGRSDGGAQQDECLSPLHMLGEAAASESQGEMPAHARAAAEAAAVMSRGMGDQPSAKRKRPTSIAVPERGSGLGGVEGATPKSPYEDSLAALHEIATSPCTFDLPTQRDREATSGMGGASGGKGGRNRPRLQVDVPGTDLGGRPNSLRDGTPGASLLTDNLMMQGETTPAILLQGETITNSDGQQTMVFRQAPVLVTLPPALSSPSAAGAGQLDTPALLHLHLPGGSQSDFMHSSLMSPGGPNSLGMLPFRQTSQSGVGSMPGSRGGVLKVEGPNSSRGPCRRVSFSGQVGILGPSSTGMPLHQPLQPPALGFGGQGAGGGSQQAWPPRLTPTQVDGELAEIKRVQTVVERLESKLGTTHPQVGKAWLALARMYQHLGEAERNNGVCCTGSMAKATEALRRAWAVCRGCAESCGTAVRCEEAFGYLTSCTSEAAAAAEAVEAGVAAAAAAAAGEAAAGNGESGTGRDAEGQGHGPAVGGTGLDLPTASSVIISQTNGVTEGGQGAAEAAPDPSAGDGGVAGLGVGAAGGDVVKQVAVQG